MDDEDFIGIVAGLNDAIAHARGDESRRRAMTGVDVKAVRSHQAKAGHAARLGAAPACAGYRIGAAAQDDLG